MNPVFESLRTTTSDNSPIPTEVLERTSSVIKSLSFNWWKGELRDTVFLIFCTSTFSCTKVDSKKYLSLSATIEAPTLSSKNTSGPPRVNLSPIIFLFFLTAKTVDGIG